MGWAGGLARRRAVLSQRLCAALRREAEELLAEVQRPSAFALWHQLQRWLLDPIRAPKARHILRAPLSPTAYQALARLQPVALELGLQPSARLVELNFTVSLPGAAPQQVHSDISPAGSSARVYTFWAALQDTDASMGPTEIWPGSHRIVCDYIRSLPEWLQTPRKVPEYLYVDGELQAVSRTGQPMLEEHLEQERQESQKAAEVLMAKVLAGPKETMTMEQGDVGGNPTKKRPVVAMDCRVFHRGGANRSDKKRFLFNASFQADEAAEPEEIHGFTGERELKAEIRAAQRLLLEVAESARHLSPERLTAPSLSSIKAAPAEPASLPALPGFGTGASTGVQLDVGSLAAHDEAVEWTLPGVRARARLGNSQPLISEAFDVDRFPEIKALRLKLFPLGSRRRTKPGHCSLYLTGPQGAHLQFLLRLGSAGRLEPLEPRKHHLWKTRGAP
ncbi:unnamed protein product [Effrenium voratum]|nr:unnamed protein product [Effrenium voratum]